MKNKITVIHHSADYDGIFCREIAKKILPGAELIGWDYGNPKLPVPDGKFYILDLSPECLEPDILPMVDAGRMIWIDHHKSAIDKFPAEFPGYRIDGVAACRLAYQWFTTIANSNPCGILIPKQDFIDRLVFEPMAVRLAGEYDIWDKRDSDAELFQHGLRSRDLSDFDWRSMLSLDCKLPLDEVERLISVGHTQNLLRPDGTTPNPTVIGLLDAGRVLQYSKTKENESIIQKNGFTFQWEGLTFLGCNASHYNSHFFTAGVKPEHDALFGFCYRGGQWTVSLYHAPGKEHHDLSKIAVRHGGGGHRGACGFTTKTLPFPV